MINSIFILSFCVFVVYFFFDINPYKFIMIFGKKGSGKTTYIAKMSQKYIKKGYKVYSNVAIPGTLLYDPSDIGLNTFEPDSIVFCDEIGLIWNNRDFKNFQRYVREWFKYQRQYKICMYAFSQAFDIDKQLRDLTDQIYIISRLGKFSLLRPVRKKIGVHVNPETGEGQLCDSYQLGSIFSLKFTFMPRYYGFFKSFNPPSLPLINSTEQSYNELSKIYTKTFKWFLYRFKCFISFLKKSVINIYVKIFRYKKSN